MGPTGGTPGPRGWTPGAEPHRPDDWPEDVGCVAYRAERALVLIDPLVPEELLEEDRAIQVLPMAFTEQSVEVVTSSKDPKDVSITLVNLESPLDQEPLIGVVLDHQYADAPPIIRERRSESGHQPTLLICSLEAADVPSRGKVNLTSRPISESSIHMVPPGPWWSTRLPRSTSWAVIRVELPPSVRTTVGPRASQTAPSPPKLAVNAA